MVKWVKDRIFSIVAVLAVVVTLGAAIGHQADAGPGTNGAITYRLAQQASDGSFQSLTLLNQSAKTMANTTPVNGSTICFAKAYDQFAAELTLSGTMTGTNPTLNVVLQGSYDKTHWFTVHSYAQINATTTPSGGSERAQFADVPASTAITRPMCYRTQSTFGGTGTVTADYGANLFGK